MKRRLESAPSVVERIAHVLAVWFGCGRFPVAPGTAGTLGALPLYCLLMWRGGPAAVLAAAVLLALVGVWASGVVVQQSGIEDPSFVVIDEVAGVLLALAFAPPTPASVAATVVLFRVFDVTKLWPADVAERLPGGWGVVADDIVAGLWTALCVWATHAVLSA